MNGRQPYPFAVARDAFVEQLDAVHGVLRGLTDEQMLLPSRCQGWAVCDLVCHLYLGFQEMLCGFAMPTDRPADTDFASYWRHDPPGDADTLAYTRFVRIIASAYSAPTRLVTHLGPTVDAVRSQARRAAERQHVEFQGHVLTTGDFLATWVLECVVHHLDLTVHLPRAPRPVAAALAVTRDAVDALLPHRPDLTALGWDDTTYVLKATGRVGLDAREREALGPLAERLLVLR